MSYNINAGHNAELLKQSPALSDYAMFVSLVREYESGGESFDAAVDKAIEHCRGCGIMGAYLENSSEVRRMLITEWNDDEYREALIEEGLEEGLERGEEKRTVEIAQQMKAKGYSTDEISNITGLTAEEVERL